MPTGPKDIQALRARAEKALSEASAKPALMSGTYLQKLLHEISVYQIELEMQNDELRRSQEQLEESRSEYAELYDFAPVGYLTFDVSGLVARANLTACGLLGIERSLLVKKPFAVFIHPDYKDFFYAHKQNVLKATTKETCQLVLKRKDGTFFDARLESIAAQVNGASAIRSVLTDITERRQFEKERETASLKLEEKVKERTAELLRANELLRKSESRERERAGELTTLLETVPTPVLIVHDPDSLHMTGNREANELLRIPGGGELSLSAPAEAKPRHFRALKDGRELRLDELPAQRAARGDHVRDFELSLVFDNGTTRHLLAYGTPLLDAEGQPRGAVHVLVDITDRKRAEEELRKHRDELESLVYERTEELRKAFEKLKEETREREQAEAQLRQAQKMEALGTLSGGIAHDFNNILAAIIGFTELVADHVPEESREAHHLKRVMESSLRGRELVRQMLAFSRKAEQEKKPLSLGSIVKEAVKLIRATTPTTISIRVNALSESGLILADPTQIQQVILNLCANAAYAMREKGGTLAIQLSDHSVSTSDGNPHGINPGLYTRLTVSDTGAGMSPDIMDKIFDPFFTTKKFGEGTGLGLSVVHGIMKQSNGHITVESTPGRGSVFTLYFPQITGDVETDEVKDDEIPTGAERVLFVDDEEALVEMGEDILAELGYDVTSRMSSREALALLKEDPSRFDLVITDQTMPEMTGLELAEKILAIRKEMPMIMCTGFSYVVDADKAKAAGIKAFAMKPLTKREIARTIRKVLDE